MKSVVNLRERLSVPLLVAVAALCYFFAVPSGVSGQETRPEPIPEGSLSMGFEFKIPDGSTVYNPVIVLDGALYGGKLGSLDPDSILRVHIIRAVPADTLLVTSFRGIRPGERWLTYEQALKQSVKGYRMNGIGLWSRREFKKLPEDKIKSLEFDSVSNEICVFTKFQKGFYITKQGNHSCLRFLFHPKERVSDQQARDSMVSCIDRYARFVPARFFSDEWTILAKWISRRVVYPPALLKDGVQGCVWLQFVIGADGRLKDYQIEESPHILFSIAVLKVVERLPAWIPATYDGEPVESNYRLPIIFKLYGSPSYSYQFGTR